MISDVKRLQQELADLSLTEQLQIVNWLIEKVLNQVSKTIAGNGVSQPGDTQNPTALVSPLLALAGRFAGGPGNTAEQAEVLTIDQRHFRLFRPKHCSAFEVLP